MHEQEFSGRPRFDEDVDIHGGDNMDVSILNPNQDRYRHGGDGHPYQGDVNQNMGMAYPEPCVLYVNCLTAAADEASLRDIFAPYGTVP